MKQRVYSNEELEALGRDFVQEALDLIDRGEIGEARGILDSYSQTQNYIDSMEVEAVCNLWHSLFCSYDADFVCKAVDVALGEFAPSHEEVVGAAQRGVEDLKALLFKKNTEWLLQSYRGADHEMLDVAAGRFVEAAFDLIENGRVEAGKNIILDYNDAHDYVHDLKTVILAKDWDLVYRECGLEAWLEIVKESLGDQSGINDVVSNVWRLGEEEGFKALVSFTSNGWKHHSCSGLSVMEDDEGVTFVLESCGSGGWLMDEGFYDGDNPQLSMVDEVGYWSWNQKGGVPVYCAHCAIEKHLQLTNWGIYAFRFGNGTEGQFPKKCGDKCRYTVLKHPKEVSEEEVNLLR